MTTTQTAKFTALPVGTPVMYDDHKGAVYNIMLHGPERTVLQVHKLEGGCTFTRQDITVSSRKIVPFPSYWWVCLDCLPDLSRLAGGIDYEFRDEACGVCGLIGKCRHLQHRPDDPAIQYWKLVSGKA